MKSSAPCDLQARSLWAGAVLLLGGWMGCATDREGKVPLDEYFSPSEVDVKPVAVSQVLPNYPASRRGLGHHVEVIVSFIVDRTGQVREAAIEPSDDPDSRDAAFEDEALAAVRRWQFRPGLKNGVPVNVACRVPVRFQSGEN